MLQKRNFRITLAICFLFFSLMIPTFYVAGLSVGEKVVFMLASIVVVSAAWLVRFVFNDFSVAIKEINDNRGVR
jgi:hypothetical protein